MRIGDSGYNPLRHLSRAPTVQDEAKDSRRMKGIILAGEILEPFVPIQIHQHTMLNSPQSCPRKRRLDCH
jgi:hypothetical protein